ncbi:general substrate transporter [Rhizopogon vinicolor AM-OR11-026]|uniref:General substrate transporter n=1 Tax=Rhizopogon vinicolor AM-OR11-026 TaxID=1314800 RepID=A0A1B7N3X2_9AGAM|nr:general substrate transporter [Rhizopogon vinicolor AM-OR11-026]
MTIPECAIADLIYRQLWWKNRGILILNICLILPLLSSTLMGLDSSMLNGLQILPGWQEYFHDPQDRTLGLMNSAQSIGSLAGTPLSPYMSDKLGRRATMFIGAFISLAGVIMQSSSTTVQIFIGARVIIGVGLAFSMNSAPLLIIELSYPTHRGKMTSLYNSLWYSGSIISAWICMATYYDPGISTWSWRIPTFVQAVIPVIQMVLIWFIPESPRFLVAKGLESQAAHVLAQYHANGRDEHDPLVLFEMAQIRHALNLERELTSGSSYLTCISTPANRRRMFTVVSITIFSQWSGNGLVSYYINVVLEGIGITKTGTKASINGGLQIFNLASALLGTMLVDKLGRRKLFLISNIGMLIVFSMWTVTTVVFDATGNTAAATATVPLIFIFFFFYSFAYTTLLVSYTVEILPYNIRAKGIAIMNFTLCGTNAFNAFVNPWALTTIHWKYYLFYCGWLALELLFVFVFIVETTGRTLEETAALFDGQNIPRDIKKRSSEAPIVLARRSPHPRASYPEKYDLEDYLELQEGSGVQSYISSSRSEESAIGFSK